ncbi:TPA: hypothetical protein ACFIY1_001829 [Neisseria gonorrhoeae]
MPSDLSFILAKELIRSGSIRLNGSTATRTSRRIGGIHPNTSSKTRRIGAKYR